MYLNQMRRYFQRNAFYLRPVARVVRADESRGGFLAEIDDDAGQPHGFWGSTEAAARSKAAGAASSPGRWVACQ